MKLGVNRLQLSAFSLNVVIKLLLFALQSFRLLKKLIRVKLARGSIA